MSGFQTASVEEAIIEELKARILSELPPEDREPAARALKHFEERLLGETIALLRGVPFVGPMLAGYIGWLAIRVLLFASVIAITAAISIAIGRATRRAR